MKTRNHPSSERLSQGAGRIPNDATRLRKFAWGLPGFLFICLCTLAPSSAQALCNQWDVEGTWVLQQSDGYTVSMELSQTGTAITGIARHKKDGWRHGGKVSGNIQGNDLYMDIYWGSNTNGIYRGTVGAQGRIEGSMYHKQIPNNKATWFSTSAMTCADVPAPNNTAGSRPNGQVVVTGKPRVPASNPATPSETKAVSRAYIGATPKVVTFRARQRFGRSLLTWDGGTDHPNAEVRVKVDGGDEILLEQQGKGTRSIAVEAGKTYVYLLTDSGQELATVTVRTHDLVILER